MRYIDRWMLLLLAVLLTACHSSDEDSSDQNCYLDIYVYAPDRPIVTRGDVGEVDPLSDSDGAEKTVHSLQIWVFKSNGGDKVGYLGVDATSAEYADPTFLNKTGQQKYRMKVAKEFADHPEAVDVYVVANTSSCDLTSLGENTKRSELEAAKIGTGYFGTTSLYNKDDLAPSGRITTNGLPMSAVEKNQPIYGSFPSLRIGSETEMTTLKLTRAVSKLRFVLCRIKETEQVTKRFSSIDAIELNGSQIPTQTFLMPGPSVYSTYETEAIKYVSESNKLRPGSIREVANPLIYAYETQSAQVYEDLIKHAADADNTRKEANLAWLKQYGDDNGLTELSSLNTNDLPQLTQLGLTYLRESDKQLTGTIKYTYSEGSVDHQETVTFSMAAPGDFLRNHSWIIYIFYMDTKIHVQVVTDIGMKIWTPDGGEENVIVHNW